MSHEISRRALLGTGLIAATAGLAACREDGGTAGRPAPSSGTGRRSAPAQAAGGNASLSPSGTPGETSAAASSTAASSRSRTSPAQPAIASPAVIAARATVPVLCWHQLRSWTGRDTSYDREVLVCPPAAFRAQLDALVRARYTTISPDQYLAHLVHGQPLPPRPVLLTFDDAQGSQIAVGLPELKRRRLTATFFIMTVVLGNPGWMSRADLRHLSAAGMTIAAHTWDHHSADRYSGRDWQIQLQQPRAELEQIIGKPVRHFAYPYGAWARTDFSHLAAAGYHTAFQLTEKPMDHARPLYTLRRQLVDSTWSGQQLLDQMRAISG